MTMPRLLASLAALLVLLGAGARGARAEHVPLVPPDRLPVVGTCAPIAEADVSHVLVGRPDELGWYRIAGVPGELDQERFVQVLAQRVGTVPAGGRSEHAVWITASGEHRWAHILKVIIACQQVGVYRVGLRVRSDSAPGVFGFPLFLPAARDASRPYTGRAAGLDVRLQTIVDPERAPDTPGTGDTAQGLQASNPALVALAAQRVVAAHKDVVANVRLASNATVAEALLVLDGLYRAGCAGIRLPLRALVASPKLDVLPVVWIGDTALGNGPLPQPLAPVAPRTEPWGVDGANRPGWLDLEVIGSAGSVAEAEAVARSWIGEGRMPAFERERAAASLAEWGHDLGAVLQEVVARSGNRLAAHLAREASAPGRAEALVTRLETEGAGLTSVVPSTLQVSLALEFEGQPVGRVDALVHLGDARASLVYARWAGAQPLEATDAAAEGLPADLRLFLEGEILALRDGGPEAGSWAVPDEVVRRFPLVARPDLARIFTTRAQEQSTLRRALAGTRFDSVRLRLGQASAALLADREVVGVAYLDIVPETEHLALRDLTVRRAR